MKQRSKRWKRATGSRVRSGKRVERIESFRHAHLPILGQSEFDFSAAFEEDDWISPIESDGGI